MPAGKFRAQSELTIYSSDPFANSRYGNHRDRHGRAVGWDGGWVRILDNPRRCVSPPSDSTTGSAAPVCVSCGSGWSAPCVSIQLTFSQIRVSDLPGPEKLKCKNKKHKSLLACRVACILKDTGGAGEPGHTDTQDTRLRTPCETHTVTSEL